jgi:hypothetical protein
LTDWQKITHAPGKHIYAEFGYEAAGQFAMQQDTDGRIAREGGSMDVVCRTDDGAIAKYRVTGRMIPRYTAECIDE